MMKNYVAGKWIETGKTIKILNPYDGSLVDDVCVASEKDIEDAVQSAQRGAKVMENMPPYERSAILSKAAGIIRERLDIIARLMVLENGKTISEAKAEVSRTALTFEYAADAAKDIHGEVIPIKGYKSAGVEKKFSFTYKVPVGVVLAIAPFNAPVNLAAHKVAVAIAAGNAVILKPATATPLASCELVKAILDAGLPAEAIQYIVVPGAMAGDILCPDKRIRKIAFTGSTEVGNIICQKAGAKKVTMELGGNAPIIVMPDAKMKDLMTALLSSFKNTGRACTSPQRIYVHKDIYEKVIQMLADELAKFVKGNPMDEKTSMGVMLNAADTERVMGVIEDARKKGARIICGGERDGNYISPCIIADVKPDMEIFQKELFGPAIGFIPFTNLDDAIAGAKDTEYGLAAGLFTQELDTIMKVTRELRFGMMNVNASSNWRIDLQSFGGLNASGLGKEGPRFAMDHYMDSITITIHSGEKTPC